MRLTQTVRKTSTKEWRSYTKNSVSEPSRFATSKEEGNKALIEAQVELVPNARRKGFENLVLKGATEEALKRFAKQLDWPPHLAQKFPDAEAQAEARWASTSLGRRA